MRTKLVTLGVYVIFWIVIAKTGMLRSIYSINSYSYDVFALWRSLGILFAALYLLAVFWDKAKWAVLLVASPLVVMAAIKAGYLGWLGYFFAFKNDILKQFLVSISALSIYGLLLTTSLKLKKEVWVCMLLILLGASAVAYEPAKRMYIDSTSNTSLQPTSALTRLIG